MPNVGDILLALEKIAPSRLAYGFDRIGLQVGDEGTSVQKSVVALDRSLAAIDFCVDIGAQVLVTHHPLIFEPIKEVTARSHVGRSVLRLASKDISLIAAHTNWDCASGGINDALTEALNLFPAGIFGKGTQSSPLKVVTFAPKDAADRVIDAASAAGAGVIGTYKRCAFQSVGTGTFYGDHGSNPTVGTPFQNEYVDEVRIEMILTADIRSVVGRAIKVAHPYETPAIDFYLLAQDIQQAPGRLGRLASSTPLRDFVGQVNQDLHTTSLCWGDPEKLVRTVAVVGGAADGEWREAQKAGADVFLTGEVKQHVALEASESGMPVISAGHFATENPGCKVLRDRLSTDIPDIDWHFFEPAIGSSGRPFYA